MSEHVRLDHFLDGMLQARITRRIIAEQHINMASLKPQHIGIVDTALHVRCGFSPGFTVASCTTLLLPLCT